MGEEEGKGRGPPRPEYIRLIKIAIVAAIVIAAVAISLPFILQAVAQPNIATTDFGFVRAPCGFFGTTQTYTYSFSLVNTGDADGFVQVGFFLDNNLVAQDTYHVPQGTSVPKTANVLVGDCADHNPGLRILEVSKA